MVDFWGIFLGIFSVGLGCIFEVHFCTLFGQFSIADLLVLRDFFDFEVPFGPLFGRLFDRTFDRRFDHFSNPDDEPHVFEIPP